MTYKTVLVHVDESAYSTIRARVAVELARLGNGHVIGTATTGISRYLYKATAAAGTQEVVAPLLQEPARVLRKHAQRCLERFEEQMRAAGCASFEKRLLEDDNCGALSLGARYADIAVLHQYSPDVPADSLYSDLPEQVAMSSGRPVLVLPQAGHSDPVGGIAVLAWDASLEASRAVQQAIPLLQAARKTRVVVFGRRSREGNHGDEPGADIALYLARQNVNVEVVQEMAARDLGNALLSRCKEFGASLLVMGCYGHSRFQEILLGGVSCTVLASAELPVLIAH